MATRSAASALPGINFSSTPTIRRLLLIVDEGPLRQMLLDLFATHGVEVDIAGDGIAAVKQLWGERYDAVVAEPDRARVAAHRLGDVVAELAPGTPVVVLKTSPRLGDASEAQSATDPALLVGEILMAIGIAVKRRASRRNR